MPSKIPMRGLRLDDTLYEKLCFIAKTESRSFNQQAAFVLKRFVSDFEQKNGPIPVCVPDGSEEEDTHSS